MSNLTAAAIECRCGALNPLHAKHCARCNQPLKVAGNKFHARKVEIDGWTFDSAVEAERYLELKFLQLSGAIRDLGVHPTYELQAAFRDPLTRQWVRAIRYEPDFGYHETSTDRQVVEDVKGGPITADASVRMRWFRKLHPEIELRIVRKGKR